MRLLGVLVGHEHFAHRLDELEKELDDHDEKFQIVFGAAKRLLAGEVKPKRRSVF